MKKLALLGLTCAMLNGCASGMTRNGTGLIFTENKDSVAVTANANATKRGEACGTNILSLVSTGDMSIDTAKKAGAITKVASVDFSQYSVLGVFTKTCTIVHGE